VSKQECPQQQESDNGQVQSQQKAGLVKVISAITIDELTDVLMNLVEDDSIEFEYEVHENTETGYFTIECKMFDTEFLIAPLGDGPFYEDLLLTAFFSAYLDPEVLCNEFNSRHKFASAVPITVESDDGDDEDDYQIIEVEKLVFLRGGVTDKHLEATIKLWTGMLMHAEQLFEGPTVEASDGDD
jgi:hypothetical protein